MLILVALVLPTLVLPLLQLVVLSFLTLQTSFVFFLNLLFPLTTENTVPNLSLLLKQFNQTHLCRGDPLPLHLLSHCAEASQRHLQLLEVQYPYLIWDYARNDG